MMASAASDPRDLASPEDIRPVVTLPKSGLPTPLLVAMALVLALALFLFLDGRRRANLEGSENARGAAFGLQSPPPPLDVPTSVPAPLPPQLVIRQAAPFAPSRAQSFPRPPVFSPPGAGSDRIIPPAPVAPLQREGPRSNEPAMVIDLTTGNGVPVNGGAAPAGGTGEAQAQAIASDSDAARATLIRNRSSLIPQGAIIAAVLETPLNSDRPGMARALVSKDARSFDGSRVLIPRGSRLIGEFKPDPDPNQRRILVTWTRLIRPDGVAIRIGSPGADTLGGAGIAGRVNTHFFERFFSAVLQSALTIGVNLASQPTANSNSVYIGLPAQAAQVGQQLIPNVNRPSTIKVREGAQIAIFVARDLDFGGTPAVR